MGGDRIAFSRLYPESRTMIMANQPGGMEAEDSSAPRFEPGQLVRHRRYGYRGVVVSCDLTCQADEAWYQKNMTQPDPNQPWYHVLVHDSTSTTYVAQINLKADSLGEPIDHPLVEHLFTEFWDGRYMRNDKSWPSI